MYLKKINVVLVALDKIFSESAVKHLNFDIANLVVILTDTAGEKFFRLGDKKFPVFSFAKFQMVVEKCRNCVWLIRGSSNAPDSIQRMKNFLIVSGVPEKNIVNFTPMISQSWLANLRYVEEHGANFFMTGSSHAEVGLNLNYIPRVDGKTFLRGVNLSDANQDLRQGYLTAKHVFAHVKPGTVKFVLIGLAPDSFGCDNVKNFSVRPQNFQYLLALNQPAENDHDRLLKVLLNNSVTNVFISTTSKTADLNFSRLKNQNNRDLPVNAVIDWEENLHAPNKKISPETLKRNVQILEKYIKLCLDNGAKPVGIIFPFAAAIRENYGNEILNGFRKKIRRPEKIHDFTCIDMFNLKLDYDCFCDMTHLNLKGSAFVSSLIASKLYAKGLLPVESFFATNYNRLNTLAKVAPKDEYNPLMEKIFELSVAPIRRKDKIKIAFVLHDPAIWCGDELYNYFARDERFETTIFLCLRTDKSADALVQKDFWHGVEQIKQRGLNVVALSNVDSVVPEQDVLIFLTPYFAVLPSAFHPENLTPKTLVTYVPYAFEIVQFDITNHWIFHVAWQMFFTSTMVLELYDRNCSVGMPRGIYSGYPRADVFFDSKARFQFAWKVARPDAKKIIWAPHWSINSDALYATFQWNFKFMYEFAKAHPEISWVVKPHPNLFFSAVQAGIFPSAAAFEDYLQKWNDLPNAQVYTGVYYQSLFVTSDGLIHDCGSFTAEYQYMQKPMIYLRRDTQKFNEIGKEILNVSYCVDGQDLDAIAATIQRVFIEGDDYKSAERQKIFDKYLNYPKANGMLASEFIYRSIADALKEMSE